MTGEASKVIGVMGSGLIGTDPFHETAWSGSSRHFFGECARQGLLHRAYGVELATPRRIVRMLANFAPDRDVWRQNFYLDTKYYDLLSHRIVDGLGAGDSGHPLLQIGGIYNLRPLVGDGLHLFSYHDGNLAQAIKSPQFPRVASARVRRAMQYEKTVCGNMDLIFTMSDYLRASFVEDFGIDENKVKTIGAGVNLDRVPATQSDKDYDSKKVLFVGADFERKGGEVLLRAFRKVRSVHRTAQLCIIGPRKLDVAPELSGGVEFLGYLSKADPAGRLRFEQSFQEASLFVMPSLYEPFGIAPLEAMVHQIPAILTGAWAFPEMVVPGVNGELVKSGDEDDLAEKIISLLQNPDRLRELGTIARQRVLDRFTWPSVVTRLRDEIAAFHRN